MSDDPHLSALPDDIEQKLLDGQRLQPICADFRQPPVGVLSAGIQNRTASVHVQSSALSMIFGANCCRQIIVESVAPDRGHVAPDRQSLRRGRATVAALRVPTEPDICVPGLTDCCSTWPGATRLISSEVVSRRFA
jgi:hypothetical protein